MTDMDDPHRRFRTLRAQAFVDLEDRAAKLLKKNGIAPDSVELLTRDPGNGTCTVRFYDTDEEAVRVLKFGFTRREEDAARIRREFDILKYLHTAIPEANDRMREAFEREPKDGPNHDPSLELRLITFGVPEPLRAGKGYFVRDNVPGTQVPTGRFDNTERRELARNLYLLHEYVGVAGIDLNPDRLVRVTRGTHPTAPELEGAYTPGADSLVLVPVSFARATLQGGESAGAYVRAVNEDMKALYLLQNTNQSE